MSLGGGGHAVDLFFYAMAKQRLGQKDAREWYDKAVAWMEEHEPNDDEFKRFRAEAEEVLGIKNDRRKMRIRVIPRVLRAPADA